MFRYFIEEEYKSQLVFLGLCFNKNISQCVATGHRREQVSSSMKFIPKLLQFLDLDESFLGST